MRNFQEKRNKQFWQSWPVLIILFILALFFAWNIFAFWQKMQDTSKNRKIAESRLTDLQEQKDRLSSDITKLNTERGVEESIRDKFGLVKEGEGMIVIVEDKNIEVVEEESKFSGFLSFFKNLFK